MKTRAPHQRLTGIVMILALLTMQLSGLHLHRHVEAAGQHHHAAAVQLHFQDFGLHANASDPAHRHDAGGDQHAHLDVETKVLDAGLLKVLAVLALVMLPALLWVLRLPRAVPRLVRRPAVPPPRRSGRYALLPPTHAPPALAFQR